MHRDEESMTGRDRRSWLIAAVAFLGIAQVALAGRAQHALAEYWLAVALAWACAALLWDFSAAEPASRWWIAPGAALVAASLIEMAPLRYQTAHRLAPLAAGLGLSVLFGPREVRRQAKALAMLLFPWLLPAPRWARDTLDLCPPTAAMSEALLKLAGVPVSRAGIELRLPGSTLLVFQGCSGLTQIFALLFLAIFAISLFPTTRREKIFLFATAVLVGFVSNAVRIAALAMMADQGQMRRFAEWHEGTLSPLCTVAAAGVALALWLPLLLRPSGEAAT